MISREERQESVKEFRGYGSFMKAARDDVLQRAERGFYLRDLRRVAAHEGSVGV